MVRRQPVNWGNASLQGWPEGGFSGSILSPVTLVWAGPDEVPKFLAEKWSVNMGGARSPTRALGVM
jgi:hypothetical protein